MNDVLKEFARAELSRGLKLLPEDNRHMFKTMYGRKNGKRSIKDLASIDIDEIIKEIPDEKLDWAMQQVQRSMVSTGSGRSTIKEMQMDKQPQEITVCSLSVVLMPNGEVICMGKSIGMFKDLKEQLKKA